MNAATLKRGPRISVEPVNAATLRYYSDADLATALEVAKMVHGTS